MNRKRRSLWRGARAGLWLLLVAAPAEAIVVATPSRVEVLPGQSSPPIEVTVTSAAGALIPAGGFLDLEYPAPLRGNTSPTQLAYGPDGAVSFRFQTTLDTPPGSYQVVLRDRSPALGSATVTLVVRPGTFDFVATPDPLTLRAGERGQVTVETRPGPGFGRDVTYRLGGLPAFLTPGGARTVSGPPYRLVHLNVVAASNATPGDYRGFLEAEVDGVPFRRPFTVVVAPPIPAIDELVPSSVAIGTRSTKVRLQGRNFEPGARIESSTAGVVAGGLRVLSPTLAEVVVSVRPHAAAGPGLLVLVNPSGGRTDPGGVLHLLAADSPAAPLGVTTVAIVHPRAGALLAAGEEVRPRGLLATTGTGTVVGSWKLDGIAFDRFVARVVAGLPVAVEGVKPLPGWALGAHELQLVVEYPQRVASEPVPVILTVGLEVAPRLLPSREEPEAGRIPRELRWTLVPGASSYEIEVQRPPPLLPVLIRVESPPWSPDRLDRERIGSERLRWRVRAVFPGEVRGEATPWKELSREPGPGPDAGAPEDEEEHLEGATPSRPRWAPEPKSHLGAVLPVAPETARHPVFASEDALQGGSSPHAWTAQGGVDAPEPAGGSLFGWRLATETTVTTYQGDEPLPADTARLALSQVTDLEQGEAAVQSTIEASFAQELEGEERFRQENESWILQATGPLPGRRLRGRVGYAPPDFLDSLELVTAGLARGGAQGNVGSSRWSFGYHQSIDPELSGALGTAGPEQDERAATVRYQSSDGRFDLRGIGLRVEDAGDDFTPKAETESYGLFARIRFGPAVTLSFEGAASDLESGGGDTLVKRDGEAFRLGIAVFRETLSYSVELRHVGDGFVNAANPGLTPGGRADRNSLDATVAKRWGRSQLGAQVQHVSGGDATGPGGEVSSISLTYSGGLSEAVQCSAGVDWTLTRADGEEEQMLPETDRGTRGGMLSLQETLGVWQLGQTATYQRLKDDVVPANDTTTSSLRLDVRRPLGGRLQLAGGMTGTRVEGSSLVGTTESFVATLQPSFQLPAWWLQITPYLSYGEDENDTQGLDTRTEAYLLRLLWSPPWKGSLLSIEVASDWNRARDARFSLDAGFVQRYTATVALRWGAGSRKQGGTGESESSTAAFASRLRDSPTRTGAATLEP